VGAAIHNATAVHQHDPVDQVQCRHAMRDHHRGATFDEFGKRFVDQLFAFWVNLAGGFVQDQDVGVFKDRAGK